MSTALESAHTFRYAVEGRISPRELADSLLGLEGLVKQSTAVLKELLPELELVHAEISMQSVQIGSIEEHFLYRLVFGKGEEAQKKFDELRKTLGLTDMTPNKVISIALILVTAYAAYLHFTAKEEKGSTTIEITEINNSFNTLAQATNRTPEELRALVDRSVNKEELKKSIVKVAHPAGDTRAAKIIVDGDERFALSESVTGRIPSKYVPDEKVETNKTLSGVRMVIRAKDLDRVGAGWFAIVGDVEEKRLPVTISAKIDADKIPVGKYIYGDVTVWYKTDKKGNKKAVKLDLHSYRETEDEDGPEVE
jgi:hypothetical protein